MMILTNQLRLHPIILKACETILQPPNPDILRVTELLNPPIIKNLMIKYKDQIVQDVADLAWSIFGTSVHSMFEKLKLAGVIQDLKMERDFNGVKLKGTLDLLDLVLKEILDFKTTTAWKWVYRDFDHFYQQLNIYRWLLAKSYDIECTKLTNILILKDWKSRDAKNDSGNYPKAPMMSLDVPVASLETTEAFISKRIKVYKDQPFTVCTPEERWCRVSYAVMEKGKKRAITGGVKNTLQEAEQLITASRNKNLYIDKREGINLRCLEYCPVRPFCPFGKTLQLS